MINVNGLTLHRVISCAALLVTTLSNSSTSPRRLAPFRGAYTCTMTETLKRGFPGMTSVKDMPIVQDMPPVGGFPSIRIQRRLPSTGPTGVAIFAGVGAVMAYGYYQVYHLIQNRKAGLRELELHRAPLIPVLQAEEDIRWVEHNKRVLEEEARIMKNVPGWKVGESNSATGRWIPPPVPLGIDDPVVR